MSKTILVVDDAPEIVRLVTKIFEARGHRLIAGRDGQEALDLVAKDRPDLIILDLDLPRVDGFEVCRRLKSDAATKAIPIVMMTAAHATQEAAKRGVNAGADEYVAKPFLREVLVHNVERLLEKNA
jgi:two-component system cell cycle response regulator